MLFDSAARSQFSAGGRSPEASPRAPSRRIGRQMAQGSDRVINYPNEYGPDP